MITPTLYIEPTQVECTALPRLNLNDILGSQSGSESFTWYAFHPVTGKVVEIDPDQLWFWTPEWQAGERMVEEDLRLGRYEDFDNLDDFLATL